MATASFQKNALVRYEGCIYRLRRIVADSLWQIEDEKIGRIREVPRTDLESAYANGALTFAAEGARAEDPPAPLAKVLRPDVDPKDIEQAKARRAYVLAVLDMPMTREKILPVIQRVAKTLGEAVIKSPSFTSLYEWVQRYNKAGRDISALMNQDSSKGNKSDRLPDELRTIVRDAVDRVYMVRERGTKQGALHAAQAAVLKENALRPDALKLRMPTLTMVRKDIRGRSAFDRHAARYGHMSALRAFRAVLGKTIPDKPLDRAEIDHTRMDLFVVDKDGNPLGRPWLTVCVDALTRCVLGFYLGFEPPSYLTVARCLKHAFLPKTDLRKRYPSIKSEWPSYGVMRTLVVDNGLEFHSESLEAACYYLGIEIQYTPRKMPWYKGIIERFQGTLNRAIAHGAPGTTFSDIFEKDDYDPAKHAVVELEQLREAINLWVADVYHQKEHRSLQTSPAAMWGSSIKPEEIELPEDPKRLDAVLGRVDFRMLTHKGIELEGLFYNSTDLRDLRMQHGDKLRVELRVDDGDIGRVVVFSPDKKTMVHAPVVSNAEGYALGMSAWQHKVCKKYAAEKIPEPASPEVWLKAKEAIRALFAGDTRKRKSRARQQRFGDGGSADAPAKAPASAPSSTSPAEQPQAPASPVVAFPGVKRRSFAVVLETRNAPDNKHTTTTAQENV